MSKKTIGGWPESQPHSLPSYDDPETLRGKVVLYFVLIILISLVSIVPLALIILGVTF